ncbi:hypothetical protein, partial [Petrachloros mirabilis]
MSDPGNYNPTPEKTSDQNTFDAAEWYERGIVLRKAGLFDQAIEQFRKAATDQVYALKAYAQIGLCHRSSRRYEEAAKAFHNALNSP